MTRTASRARRKPGAPRAGGAGRDSVAYDHCAASRAGPAGGAASGSRGRSRIPSVRSRATHGAGPRPAAARASAWTWIGSDSRLAQGFARRKSPAIARIVSSSLYLPVRRVFEVARSGGLPARGRRASGCSARSGPRGRSRASCRRRRRPRGTCRPASSTRPRLFQATRSSGNFSSTALRSFSASSSRPSSLATRRAEEGGLAPAGPALLGLARATRARRRGGPRRSRRGRGSAGRRACPARARPTRVHARAAPLSGRPGGRGRCRSRSSAARAGRRCRAVSALTPRAVAPVRRSDGQSRPRPCQRRHRQRRVRGAEREGRVVARELPVVRAGRERDRRPSRPSGPSRR